MQRKPLVLQGRERPRLLLDVVANTKYSMLYAAGAVMGLRDIGVLPLTAVFSGSGMGTLLLWFLVEARERMLRDGWYQCDQGVTVGQRIEHLWRNLLMRPVGREPDVLMECFFRPLLHWAECNQEWRMFRRRVGHCRLGRWLDPWSGELQLLLREDFPDAAAVWNRFRRPVQSEGDDAFTDHRPVFLFNAAQPRRKRVVCLTNDPSAPQLPALDTDYLRPGRDVHPLDFVAGACTEPALFLPPDVALPSGTQPLCTACTIDPLGLQSVRNYYIKERLGPMPSSSERKRDLQAALGPEAREKPRHVSQKLLLIDGFSRSPGFELHYDAAVHLHARVQHDQLMGPHDHLHETLLLYGLHNCAMFPTVYAPADLDPDESSAGGAPPG